VITAKGVGYVPQGRRVWPSLSVDEHLRLARRRGPWTVERIYQTFPRLAERKANGGAELSGGEQQMLAISRALVLNPKLLVMDEPTEGLAPIVVQQVVAMVKALAAEGEISVLLIEQNLGVAMDIADTVDVMVNGRIARSMTAAELAADRELQQRLLGVKTDTDEAPETTVEDPAAHASYWTPTIAYLQRQLAASYRVEAVDTAGHWPACRGRSNRRCCRQSSRATSPSARRRSWSVA